jgi:phage terminase small subunit
MARTDIKLTSEQLELASKLTPLQRKFVLELIKPGTSQRQAYLTAGGKAKTESAQDASASVMISNAKVKAFYDSLLSLIASDSIMTKQEALERLSKTARATIHDICTFKLTQVGEDADGNPVMQTVWEMKNAEEIDPVIAASIKSVTFTKTGPKIEMYDAHGSIKLLSDIQGWNAPKKTELTGKDGQALAINADVPEVAAALAGLMAKL